MFKRIFPDPFIPVLLLTLLLATILPVRGAQISVASAVATIAVGLLFFLHGVRLPRQEVLSALAHWRLHGAIFAFCFGVMPLAAIMVHHWLGAYLPPMLALGLLYLGILPSTVQSATTASSMAGGNVAASVVAAALVNLAGMILSPLLFAAVAGGEGGFVFSSDIILRILMMLMAPFLLGQMLQGWLRPIAMRYRSWTVQLDRTAIAIAVYVALSGAVVAGLWRQLSAGHLTIMVVAVAILLMVSFGGAWSMARIMRFNRPDSISVLFASAQKSIAVGAPLAAILFPPAQAGFLLLPVIVFHVVQLILSAWMAAWMGAQKSPP
jgi:solute carrier family 10 (sodium/bile acid cotransporter), member 7